MLSHQIASGAKTLSDTEQLTPVPVAGGSSEMIRQQFPKRTLTQFLFPSWHTFEAESDSCPPELVGDFVALPRSDPLPRRDEQPSVVVSAAIYDALWHKTSLFGRDLWRHWTQRTARGGALCGGGGGGGGGRGAEFYAESRV